MNDAPMAPKKVRRRPLPPGLTGVYFKSPRILDARVETIAEAIKVPKREALAMILDLGLQTFTGLLVRQLAHSSSRGPGSQLTQKVD